ncbi:MAG: S8/S53 family peptidase [Solirubrobacteraceae bacterium]|nr:S8/S53 family peptidase [Patulibacter sp.]
MESRRGWPYDTTDPWERAILDDPDIAFHGENGNWFFYRPGQLVVDPAALRPTDPRNEYEAGNHREAAALLKELGARPVTGDAPSRAEATRKHGTRSKQSDAATAKRLGLELVEVHDDGDLPEHVRRLRAKAPNSVSLNHVLIADQHRVGGCGPAAVAPRPGDVPGRDIALGAGIRIAVIDTGLDESLDIAVAGALDQEVPDSQPDKILDPAAGHGTFVTGIIRRFAPGAEVMVHRALLGPAGVASDLEVAEALLEVGDVDLINCSFGGASQDDAPPLVIAKALAKLDPKTVVVCAAGNQDESRPHWPGAFKGVYAVGSVVKCEKTGTWCGADYSNYGWWVDASAPGSDVVSTFLEFKEEAGTLRNFEHGALWSGTSFATPKVVAAIAQLAAKDDITASEAAYRLIDSPGVERLANLGALIEL